MKTRIEIQKFKDKETMYLAQADFSGKFKYIGENPIGFFGLHDEPQSQFNWIEGAEKLIDKYILYMSGNVDNPSISYIEYPDQNKYPVNQNGSSI